MTPSGCRFWPLPPYQDPIYTIFQSCLHPIGATHSLPLFNISIQTVKVTPPCHHIFNAAAALRKSLKNSESWYVSL